MYGLHPLRNGYALILCGMLLAACTSSTPTKVLDSYGTSVNNMIAEQTYSPEDEVEELDGEKARVILDAYRKDVPNPQQVERPVIEVSLD